MGSVGWVVGKRFDSATELLNEVPGITFILVFEHLVQFEFMIDSVTELPYEVLGITFILVFGHPCSV